MQASDPFPTSAPDDELPYIQLTQEGRALFDRACRREIGMSGEEFLRRDDAGESDGIEEDAFGRRVVELEMIIPFARVSHYPTEEDATVFTSDPLPACTDDEPPYIQLTPEEGRAFFDAACRRDLGMSGEEFLRRYDSGEFDGIEEDDFGRKVIVMEMRIPFVRPD